MNITARHPILPFELRDSAPSGVSVTFDAPTFTRDLNPEAVAAIVVTIRFAAEIDVQAVAAWLVAKLSARKGTEAHYERTKIKIEIGPLKAAIEREIYKQGADGP